MQSDKVPYYILDLLQQVPSVYVAGLGRFDAIFHPAVVEIHEARIKPPYFEPKFEVDAHASGEMLPAYMHYVSGITTIEAIEAISAFVQRVQQHVNSGEPYTIEQFGTFSKSHSSILHFTPDWDAFNLSFKGLDTIEILLPKEIIPAALEVQEVYTTPKPIVIYEESVPEPIRETSWVTDPVIEKPEPGVEVTPPPGVIISDATSRLWWTILLSALILITLLCAYLAWDILSNRKRMNQYANITNDSVSVVEPEIIITDTIDIIEEEIPVDTAPIIEPEPESPPETKPVVSKSDGSACFIVVGAFSNNDNVTNMEERLVSLGYSTEQIKGGSLTKVAIRTSCDQETLRKTLSEARASINSEAWIY